jgi:hypothetical protein
MLLGLGVGSMERSFMENLERPAEQGLLPPRIGLAAEDANG